MLNRESVMGPLLVAVIAAIGLALVVTRTHDGNVPGISIIAAAARAVGASDPVTPVATSAPAPPVWAASAPGRVEPKGGEVRLSPQANGRIAQVMVGVNDKVIAGDVLVLLDDSEIEARLAAASAEASVRRRDRDQETVTGAAKDRRAAEDAAFSADRLFSLNRSELDRWLVARKNGLASDADVATARDTVIKARNAMTAARLVLRRALTDTAPAQTRLEAALAAARSDLSAADALSERMRIRAPEDGTVLRMDATVGESVAASPENVLVVLGDVSALRVKAEIEERDIGKVAIGQAAVVRSDAFPGHDFEGRVAAFGQALGPSKLGQKGPRKMADTDVLEITVDLTGQAPGQAPGQTTGQATGQTTSQATGQTTSPMTLLPGMRVDVFLRPQ